MHASFLKHAVGILKDKDEERRLDTGTASVHQGTSRLQWSG